MSEIETGAAAAAPEAAAIAPAQTAEPVTVMTALEKTMSDAYDKINPPRDNGKFAPKSIGEDKPNEAAIGAEPSDDKPPEITDQNPVEAEVKPPAAAIDAPISWSAEMKAKWATLPPDVQAYASQREGESHKRISELGQQVKAFEPIRELVEPLRQMSARNGVSEKDGLQRLLAANEFLDRSPREAIEWLAKSYGLDLRTSQGEAAEGDQSDYVRSLEARVTRAERLASEVHNKHTARERSEAEQAQASLASLIDNFAKDKADFAEVEADVAAHVAAIRQAEPGLKPETLLEKAYEAARWANPNTRTKILEQQRKDEETKRVTEQKKKADEAKKAGSLNVKSSSASPSKKGTWEQTLREVGERIA
jgi:hypothetical protein